MPATPHKREAFVLCADAGTWEWLDELIEQASRAPGFGGIQGDRDLRQFQTDLRYKLWRTGHRSQPE